MPYCKLLLNLKEKNFYLENVNDNDINNFIHIEKVSHYKYVKQNRFFFGDWNKQIIIDSFYLKKEMTFFKKIIHKDKIIGFLGYNKDNDKIDNIFIRIINEYQNMKIGTLFLSYLKSISINNNIPAFISVIKTNPAKNLYIKLGFSYYKEDSVFYFLKFN